MKQDEARIERIYALFDEYRQAYAAEWQRLERCERLYMGEHWHDVPQSDTREPRPVTPVLQSTIENIRADLMDQMPEAIITADDPANDRDFGRKPPPLPLRKRICKAAARFADRRLHGAGNGL